MKQVCRLIAFFSAQTLHFSLFLSERSCTGMEQFSAHREMSFRCIAHQAETTITIDQNENKFELFDGDGDGKGEESCEGVF